MKTIKVTPEEMGRRIARFNTMEPYQQQLERTNGIPAAVLEKLAAHNVFPILVPAGYKGRSANAPLKGAPGLIVALAACPPGDGPALHCHETTIENFFVVNGRFRVKWGDAGEDSIVMEQHDFLSVPPGVCRTFINISDQPGMMLAMIQVPTAEQADPSAFPPAVADEVRAEFGADVFAKLEQVGLRFDAGVESV